MPRARARCYGMQIDRRIAALAASRSNLVTRAELRAVGLSYKAIRRREDRGTLHQIHPGVFSIGTPVLGRRSLLLAAIIAVGQGSVLSHRTAPEIHMLLPAADPIHVTTTRRGGDPIEGIVVH